MLLLNEDYGTTATRYHNTQMLLSSRINAVKAPSSAVRELCPCYAPGSQGEDHTPFIESLAARRYNADPLPMVVTAYPSRTPTHNCYKDSVPIISPGPLTQPLKHDI